MKNIVVSVAVFLDARVLALKVRTDNPFVPAGLRFSDLSSTERRQLTDRLTHLSAPAPNPPASADAAEPRAAVRRCPTCTLPVPCGKICGNLNPSETMSDEEGGNPAETERALSSAPAVTAREEDAERFELALAGAPATDPPASDADAAAEGDTNRVPTIQISSTDIAMAVFQNECDELRQRHGAGTMLFLHLPTDHSLMFRTFFITEWKAFNEALSNLNVVSTDADEWPTIAERALKNQHFFCRY